MFDNEENWYCDYCKFENSFRMINCEMCFKEKITDLKLIQNMIMEENFYENLPPNLEYKLRLKADLLKRLLENNEFALYLKERILKEEITIGNLDQILSENYVLNDIIDVLKTPCPICMIDFPLSNMHEMFSCNCRFCKSCFTEWLKNMIMNKSPNDWICPQCNEKEMTDINKNVHFLAFRSIIDSDPVLKDLFNNKLRDQHLETNSKFRWCKNEECINGFEIIDDLQVKVACVVCNTFMCTSCNVKWHDDETCIEYNLRINIDPNLPIIQLLYRIECPQCKKQYELANGGCLHFTCKNCALEFCGCCNETYFKKCNKPNCNLFEAFHAHHPKNCTYFTRDYPIEKLEVILKTIFT